MDASKTIVFYDIASGPPVTCYAPNPWKARYVLNFKGVDYQTEWVELPDVEATRKKLNAPANRTFWDGSPFYTLPVIKNTLTGEVISDSFDIALYLDRTFTEAPSLFPPSTIGLQAAFNKQADGIFTPFVMQLCIPGMPLNPASLEVTRASMVWRAQKQKWEDFDIQGEERTRVLGEFKAALTDLAKFYNHGDGPFMAGRNVLYADLIVGAWLAYLKATLKKQEWEDLQTWHNGFLGKLHRALEKYAEVK